MNLKSAARRVLLILVAFSSSLHAGTLDSSVIGLFPKNASEFAYADLSQARQFPWFAQLEQQVLPVQFMDFVQFLKSTGIDPDSQINEVAWAVAPESTKSGMSKGSSDMSGQIVGVAIGNFSPSSVQALFKTRKLPHVDINGYTLYASESVGGSSSLYLVFIDSNTLAFGPRSLLKRLIAVHYGEEESLLANATMVPLINQANGDGVFWGIFDGAVTRRTILQLVPQVSKFPQAGAMITRVRALVVTMRASSGLETDFHAVSASSGDAMVLSQLLQAGLLVRQYEAGNSNPDLAQILGSVSVASDGDQLNISVSVTSDQVTNLIEHNMFVQ